MYQNWYHLEYRNPVTRAFVLTARNQASASSLEALRIRGFEVLPEKIKSLHALHRLAQLKLFYWLLSRQLISCLVIILIFPAFVFGFFFYLDTTAAAAVECAAMALRSKESEEPHISVCALFPFCSFPPLFLLVSLFSKCDQGDLGQLGCR